MALTKFYDDLTKPSTYFDRSFRGTREEFFKEISESTSLYIGNLSFYTTEEQIYELFSKCGEIKRIIMGLDRLQRTPCGFCFVEYYTREDALACKKYLDGTILDDRIIRCDIDRKFTESRQFGRGKTGGQVRDEHRSDYDSGRGGWGKEKERLELEMKRREEQEGNYDLSDVPQGSNSNQ